MKFIYFSIIILLSVQFSYSQEFSEFDQSFGPQISWNNFGLENWGTKFKLSGKVKKFKHSTSKIDSIGDETNSYAEEKYFNSEGLLTDEITYSKNGTNISHEKIVYIKNSKNLIEQVSKYDNDGSLLERTKYDYDEFGKLNRKDHFSSDGELLFSELYKYNKTKKINEVITKGFGGAQSLLDLSGKKFFGYDTMDRCIDVINEVNNVFVFKRKSRKFNTSGKVESITEYEYDKQKISKIIYYNYSKNGLLISEVEKTENGKLIRSKNYKYDTNNQKIEVSGLDENNNLAWKILIKYDSAGKEIENTSYRADGTPYERESFSYNKSETEFTLLTYEIKDIFGELRENLTGKTVDTFEFFE